jgi:SAM-dependent methyltransferase
MIPARPLAAPAYDDDRMTARREMTMAATAVEAWDDRWATSEGRAGWLVPDPAVAALVPVLKARGAQHVLDLGCGVGRHALLFAENGFAVEAIDGAAAGLDFDRTEATARGLRVSLRQADADTLPFADGSFDYVLSWNVIFHGTMGDVGRRLAEIWRVLRPGGLYQGTMLSKRDAQFGVGRSVAPDTFIRGNEAKAHPHYYCDLTGLATLLAGFEVLSLSQDQHSPGAWHWHVLAERRNALEMTRSTL